MPNPEQGHLERRVAQLEQQLAAQQRALHNLPARWAQARPAFSRVAQFTLATNQTITANGTATRVALDSESESDGGYLYHGRVGLETSGGNKGAMTPPAGVYLVWYRFSAGVTRYSANDINDATNASPIVLTTSNAHSFSAGDLVRVNEIAGNLAANGIHVVTEVTSTTLTLGNTTGSGAFSTSTGRAVVVPPIPGSATMYLRRKPDGGSYAAYSASLANVNFPAVHSYALAATVLPISTPPFVVEVEADDEFELSLTVGNDSEDVTLFGGGAFAPETAAVVCWKLLGRPH